MTQAACGVAEAAAHRVKPSDGTEAATAQNMAQAAAHNPDFAPLPKAKEQSDALLPARRTSITGKPIRRCSSTAFHALAAVVPISPSLPARKARSASFATS